MIQNGSPTGTESDGNFGNALVSKAAAADRWDERYTTGDLPWDAGVVEIALTRVLEDIELPGGQALEIGCGTGTNAIELARRGFSVVAIDISQKAIEMAAQKADEAGVEGIEFRSCDVLEELPVHGSSIDFAFDRGCLHSFTAAQRPVVAWHMAQVIKPGGWWLTLCGNADELTEQGPPRVSAAHLAAVLEPLFEIHEMRRGRFTSNPKAPNPSALKWAVLMRRREG